MAREPGVDPRYLLAERGPSALVLGYGSGQLLLRPGLVTGMPGETQRATKKRPARRRLFPDRLIHRDSFRGRQEERAGHSLRAGRDIGSQPEGVQPGRRGAGVSCPASRAVVPTPLPEDHPHHQEDGQRSAEPKPRVQLPPPILVPLAACRRQACSVTDTAVPGNMSRRWSAPHGHRTSTCAGTPGATPKCSRRSWSDR